MFVKNRNFRKISKCLSKIEIFESFCRKFNQKKVARHRFFGGFFNAKKSPFKFENLKKSKCLSKIEMFVKNRNFP